GARASRRPRHCALRQDLAVFFFSSRRRHTRLQGDWSSDVCSSDLYGSFQQGQPPSHRATRADSRLLPLYLRQKNTPTFSRSSSLDRKSTRLNSSHLVISYAVFCLKKKTSV